MESLPCSGMDALPSLDAGGRGLLLPQLDVSDLVDSPQEVLPFRRIGWELVEGDVEGMGVGDRVGTWISMTVA